MHPKDILIRSKTLACVLGLVALAAPLATFAGTTTLPVTNDGFSNWSINGTLDPPLVLKHGETYVFDLSNVAANHPFNINTVNTTGNNNRYNNGVSNNGATGETDITFVVPADAPETLHYNCGNHAGMNGPIVVPLFADSF